MKKISKKTLHPQPQMQRQIGPYTVELLDLCRFRMDGGGLFGVVPKPLWERAYPHVDSLNRVHMAAFALLVRGNGLVLVADAGLGDKLNPKQEEIYEVNQPSRVLPLALEARGVAVEDVTHFVYTHLHFDHAGGATEADAEGRLRPVFPKAKHLVQASQLGWANQPTDKDKASFDPQNWEAVNDAGLLRELEGSHSPAPGIELRIVHGHTSGMQMVLIQDGDDNGLLYSVDLFPTAAHLKPHYLAAFDNHPLAALEEKRVYLEELYERKWHLAFGHDPYVAPARVIKDARGQFALEIPNG